MSKNAMNWLSAVAVGLAVGCSQSNTQPATTRAAGVGPTAQSAYLLSERPVDAEGVAAARDKNASGEVAVEGLIGGSEEPFVEGLAAFTIVDPAISPCAADEGCPTPWDYCCNTDDLKGNTAMVKVVDADGKTVSQDARELLGVKELSKVVVRGKTTQDEQGNLTVLAEKVYVAQD